MMEFNASEPINKWAQNQKYELNSIMFYQELTAKYFTSEFMKKNDFLLLYWDMGSGKTLGALNCAISAIDYAPKEYTNIVIISPKSVQHAFEINLKILCNAVFSKNANEKFNYYLNKLVFIPSNAWNSFFQLQEQLQSFEHKIYIIDEVHLFIKSVMKTNLTPEEEKLNDNELQYKGNCKKIYDTIRRLKHKKILALTGTPLAKFSFELVPLFNLNGNTFTEDYKTFETKYYDREKEKLKPNAEKILLKKLDGLVSYVAPIETGVKAYPIQIVRVEMSEPQFKRYIYDYSQELKEAGFASKSNSFGFMFGSISTFHTKTFQDCIYYNENLFMDDYEEITGISDELNGKLKTTTLSDYFNKKEVSLNEYFNNLNYIGENRHNIKEFKFDNIHCPKILKMFEDSQKYKGIKCFYFRLSQTYGCDTMAKYLESKGYELPHKNENIFEKKKKRYILFTGDFSDDTRNYFMKLSNDTRNLYGEYIEYVILSPSGQVGITIKNCRYLGIGTCEFAISSLQQIITRINRFKSHDALPPVDRTIHQYMYFMTKNEKYFKKHKQILKEILARTDPLITYECPLIEEIIYCNSIHDDKPMQAFREVLYKASITEKLIKYKSTLPEVKN